MEDPDFKPRKRGQSKRSAAYAVCTAQYKKRQQKKSTIGFSDDQDDMITENCICIECGHQIRKSDTECQEVKCPKCGLLMVAKERKSIPMRITKATLRDGRMYFQAAISDTDWDDEDERMTVSLFEDFKSRIKAQRQETDYEPPFVSLSHYRRMDDKSGEMGLVHRLWTEQSGAATEFFVDGYFHDTKLGQKCFEVAQDELQQQKAGEKIDNPVRHSLAFYPKQVAKDDLGRISYLKGVFDHTALTRVPINTRSRFTQVMEKSMAKTRKEDALSIVGEDYEDEIDTLEELQHQKADVLDELVIKSEEDSPHTEEQEIILRASLEELGYDEDEIEKARWDYAYKKSLPNSAYAWVETGPGCEKKDGETPQKCRHLPYKDKSGNIDCGHVRAALQAIGGARTGKKMTGVPSAAKQKLRSALKSCQRKKSDIEDAEREAELEQARIEGFNLALDLDAPDTEEVTTMTEKKSEQLDLEKIIEAMKPEEPEEEKSEAEPTDPIDEHTNLLKRIPPAEGSRAQKLEAAEGVLRSLAAHIAAEIDKLTPATTEDIAKSLSSELDAKLRPIADKIAVLEAAVTKPQSDSPESKALKSESFYVSPEDSMLAALGESKEKSRIRELARQGLGLPEDQL